MPREAGPPASRYDVLAIGESLGLVIADRPGGVRSGSALRLGFGGAESNVAIGVARLGGRAAWAGRIGDDTVGRLIVRELRAENVAVYATVDPQSSTALMMKERPYPGATRVSYYRDGLAGSRLSPSDLPADQIAAAEVLHVTGITAALSTSSIAALHAAIDHATACGRTVSFDVNHRRSLWPVGVEGDHDARQAYRALAARAHIVFAGEDEAELLTGETTTDGQLEALLALGPRHAIVKRGAHGATAAAEGGAREDREALNVPVVDTVGAGDAFVAGWLAEFVRGSDAGKRLDTAIACGAFACTAEGDWEAAPTRTDLEYVCGDSDPVRR